MDTGFLYTDGHAYVHMHMHTRARTHTHPHTHAYTHHAHIYIEHASFRSDFSTELLFFVIYLPISKYK